MRRTTPRRRAALHLLAIGMGATALVAVPTPEVVAETTFRTVAETHVVALAARPGLGGAAVVAGEAAEEPEVQGALAADQRRRGRRATTFGALGLSTAEEPGGPVLVRGQVAGRWTPWFEVAFVPDEAPDVGAARASQPVWFGDATAFEVDAPADVQALDVHLVRDEEAGTTRRLVTSTAAAAGAPTIRSRAAWGARAPRAAPAYSDDLSLAVVHHSVTGNAYSASQVPAMLRSIQAYHQDVQGWNDIAYSFAVDRFGTVWEGRGGGTTRAVLGGHSQGFNTSSTGVVVLGDFTAAEPTAASLEATARVIAWKLALHRIDPASTVPYTTAGSSRYAAGTVVQLPRVVGHRDVQSTSCPGSRLYARMSWLRSRVAQLVPGYQAGLPSQLVGLDRNGDGLEDALQVRVGPSTDTRWTATGLATMTRSALTVEPPYRPVVGDFDGNGRDDVIWHGSGTTRDRVWWNGGSSSAAITVKGSYLPTVGDFDGDGVDDVLWYAPGVAADSVWYGGPDRRFSSRSHRQDLIAGVPVAGDLDGDGRDDVLWYGRGSSSDTIWWSKGRGFSSQATSVNGEYQPVAVHDAIDGRDEVLFIHRTASTSYRWQFDRSRRRTSTSLPIPGYDGQLVVGDFDDDRREDVFILARNGSSAIWYSTSGGIFYRRHATDRTWSAVAGRMEWLNPRDDLLLVSATAGDQLWSTNPDRTVTRRTVG